jgi:hypothetical protein
MELERRRAGAGPQRRATGRPLDHPAVQQAHDTLMAPEVKALFRANSGSPLVKAILKAAALLDGTKKPS